MAAKTEVSEPAEQQIACSRCSQPMRPGFALENRTTGGQVSIAYREVALWVDGPVKRGWLGGLKVHKAFAITGYRCTACGFLELFAK